MCTWGQHAAICGRGFGATGFAALGERIGAKGAIRTGLAQNMRDALHAYKRGLRREKRWMSTSGPVATLEDVSVHGHVLRPGRGVGVAASDVECEPFVRKLERLTEQMTRQFAESGKLETSIRATLAPFAIHRDEPIDTA